MKTKTIELYEFAELSESAKAKVLENQRDINTDYDWHKWSIEEQERELESMGFESPDISFTGFYSQGDGASFTCKSVDVDKFLTAQKSRSKFKAILKALKAGKIEAEFSIDRLDHHYSHEYTITASSEILYSDGETKNYAAIETEEGQLRNLVLETARKLSRKIYRELETEYEYLTSNEAVIETIKANEYTFTAYGKMENL